MDRKPRFNNGEEIIVIHEGLTQSFQVGIVIDNKAMILTDSYVCRINFNDNNYTTVVHENHLELYSIYKSPLYKALGENEET